MRRLDNDRLLHKTLPSICLDSASNVQHCASSIFCGSRVLFTRPASTFFYKKKTTLKLSPTVVFTHLKIILLQYFQFSIFNNKRCPNRP